MLICLVLIQALEFGDVEVSGRIHLVKAKRGEVVELVAGWRSPCVPGEALRVTRFEGEDRHAREYKYLGAGKFKVAVSWCKAGELRETVRETFEVTAEDGILNDPWMLDKGRLAFRLTPGEAGQTKMELIKLP